MTDAPVDLPSGQVNPLELIGVPAACFVPAHGLACPRDDMEVAGIRFVRLPLAAWQWTENRAVVDLYSDYVRARPRLYAVFPLPEPVGNRDVVEPLLNAALARFQRFVIAARIARAGTLIDAHAVVPVLCSEGNIHRLVGGLRFRLDAVAFGAPFALPGKVRSLGDRAAVRAPTVVAPTYADYPLDDAAVTAIARISRRLDVSDTEALGPVLRNFSVGHDVFQPERVRLICLLSAFEAIYGEFRDAAVAARRVARLLDERGQPSARDAERRVQAILKPARNALAHGADHRRDVDLAAAEEVAGEALRAGIDALLTVASRHAAVAGAEPVTPAARLRDLLDRAIAGDPAASRELRDESLPAGA